MELIDFCNSEEGARLLFSGVEGVHWEEKDGGAVPTESYAKLIKEDPSYTTTTGISLYNKLSGLRETQVLSDNTPANVLKSNEQKAVNLLEIDKAYCEYYSRERGKEFLYPGMVLNDMWENGEVDTWTDYIMFTSLVQSPSESTLNILSQCDQYMNVQGVKAIMAADNEEFEQIRQEAMEALNDKGFEEARQELISLYDTARTEADSFAVK